MGSVTAVGSGGKVDPAEAQRRAEEARQKAEAARLVAEAKRKAAETARDNLTQAKRDADSARRQKTAAEKAVADARKTAERPGQPPAEAKKSKEDLAVTEKKLKEATEASKMAAQKLQDVEEKAALAAKSAEEAMRKANALAVEEGKTPPYNQKAIDNVKPTKNELVSAFEGTSRKAELEKLLGLTPPPPQEVIQTAGSGESPGAPFDAMGAKDDPHAPFGQTYSTPSSDSMPSAGNNPNVGAHEGQSRVEPEKGTTSAAPTSNATGAQKEVQSAKARLDKAREATQSKSERLSKLLANFGPALNDRQKAQFIQKFQQSPENKAAYAEETKAAEALAESLDKHQATLGQAAVKEPQARKELYEALKSLASSPASAKTVDVVEKLFKDPAVGRAFNEFKDFDKEVLQPAANGLATRILAENNGNPKSAMDAFQEKLTSLDKTFADFGKPLFDAKDGAAQATMAINALEDAANGNYDHFKALGKDFANQSTGQRLLTGGLILFSAYTGAAKANQGEYVEAVKEFAGAGKGTVELVAGVTQRLVDLGRNAENGVVLRHGGKALAASEFALRFAPGLGAVASAASLAVNAHKAGETANPGYAVALFGDAIGVLGGAVGAFPGGQVPGAVASGIGAGISAVGELLGNVIEEKGLDNERQRLLDQIDIKGKLQDALMNAGGDRLDLLTEKLGLKPDQLQNLMQSYPELTNGSIGLDPEPIPAVEMLAKSGGLNGDQLYQLLDGVIEEATSRHGKKAELVLEPFFRTLRNNPAQNREGLKQFFDSLANDKNIDPEFKVLWQEASRILNGFQAKG
ncbi:hypothetical protein [Myxococcus xanthus]|uniref:hypothetical protein n=1 Tax=Myxococcus xanthus TaxID=34 RepID=UPI001F2423BD|nr:hypothetical protein [Myxococcus xanthus]